MSKDLVKELDNLNFNDTQDLVAQEDKKLLEKFDNYFVELSDLSNQMSYVQQVKTSIENFGITSDIVENNKEKMFNLFEFDLEAFANGTSSQVNFCIEGLGTTLANIVRRMIEIIDKIIDFFMVDSGFARFINRMEMYKSVISQTLVSMKDFAAVLDLNKANNVEVVNYPYPEFTEVRSAISKLITKLVTVNISDINNLPTIDQVVSDYSDLVKNVGLSFGDKGGVVISPMSDYLRRDSLITLRWTVQNVKFEGDALYNGVFQSTAQLTRTKLAFVRHMRAFRLTLAEILEGKTNKTIPPAECIRGCNVLKQLMTLTMDRACGLGLLWKNMVSRLYAEAGK